VFTGWTSVAVRLESQSVDGFALFIPLYLIAVGAFAFWSDQRKGEVLLLGMWGILGLGVLYELGRVIWSMLP